LKKGKKKKGKNFDSRGVHTNDWEKAAAAAAAAVLGLLAGP
jgi:hypothetical protein